MFAVDGDRPGRLCPTGAALRGGGPIGPPFSGGTGTGLRHPLTSLRSSRPRARPRQLTPPTALYRRVLRRRGGAASAMSAQVERRPFVRGSAGDGTSVQVAARHGIEGDDSQHETADGEDAHAQRPGRVPRAELERESGHGGRRQQTEMEPAGDGEERQRLRQSRLSAVRARADDRLGVGQRSGDGDGPERSDTTAATTPTSEVTALTASPEDQSAETPAVETPSANWRRSQTPAVTTAAARSTNAAVRPLRRAFDRLRSICTSSASAVAGATREKVTARTAATMSG